MTAPPKNPRPLRITIAGMLALIAVLAVVLTWFRPMSERDAIALALAHVQKTDPGYKRGQHEIRAAKVAGTRKWKVAFIRKIGLVDFYIYVDEDGRCRELQEGYFIEGRSLRLR
jgi:hypothetical protein